jgi:hypothetical protein
MKRIFTILTVLVFLTGYTFAQVSIHDIQYTEDAGGDSPYLGQTVSTGGVVTAVAESGFYLQSGGGAWSGVYVYDNSSEVAIGDSVTFTALVDEYYNMTELKDVADLVVVSNGNPLNVSQISTADVNAEEYEGCLVSVYNAVCTNGDLGYGEWEVDDGSGPCRVDDMMLDYTPQTGTAYSVTGVVHFSYSNFKIEPRTEEDVNIVTGVDYVTGKSLEVYPNPASDYLFVNHVPDNGLEVTLFDVLGNRVFSIELTAGNQMIDISTVKQGYYFVKLGKSGEVKRILIK